MSSPHRLHPMQLKIGLTPHGADSIVTLAGSLAAGEAVEAQRQLLGLTATCTGRIVLDCTQLTYVSSAGLRTLLALQRSTSGRSQGLIFAGVTEQVRNILDIAGISSHLRFAPSVPQAFV